MSNKRPTNYRLNSDQVWGTSVKAFEQIFQFLQLHLIKDAQVRLEVYKYYQLIKKNDANIIGQNEQ